MGNTLAQKNSTLNVDSIHSVLQKVRADGFSSFGFDDDEWWHFDDDEWWHTP